MLAQDVRPSPFLDPGPLSTTGSLSILHLKRDLLIPTVLSELDEANEGYDEGRVTNTRFGSFPHSTLIGLPWGSQVRASEVDTGSRGRKGPNQNFGRNKKRKREDKLGGDDAGPGEGDNSGTSTPKVAVVASTGFIHLLPPTPESWTASLPHRTQVVYTPDYSYILHRLRVRPGSVLIEAGAGSGSFSHASARAVFNGYPEETGHSDGRPTMKRRKIGKVYSYEFHEQRVEKLREEVKTHGLSGIVELTHRDVCENGFLREKPTHRQGNGNLEEDKQSALSPEADAIFLDLPAPWLALRHLTRKAMTSADLNAAITSSKNSAASTSPSPLEPEIATGSSDATAFLSPLNPAGPVRICTFSPCIEQVQRTISTLRHLGWVDIEMVEIAHKRIEVWRERVGLHEDGVRGLNVSPATVEEAIERLKEVEGRFRVSKPVGKSRKHVEGTEDANNDTGTGEANARMEHDTEILAPILPSASTEKHARPRNPLPVFRQGRIIHRPEPELKTHTSYLVFAVLPQEWSAEDEAQARARWPVKPKEGGLDAASGIRGKKSKRQMKREAAVAAAAEERGEEDMGVDAEAMDLQLGGDETADGAANGS